MFKSPNVILRTLNGNGKLYTKELLSILNEVSTSGFSKLHVNEYKPILERILEKMLKYQVYETTVSLKTLDIKSIEPLTARQITCFNSTINCLKYGHFSEAYHELHDCIYDYGRGKDEYDFVNVNEYNAFKFLIEQFLDYIKQNNENNSNMSCSTSYKEFEESWIESARLQSLNKPGYTSLVKINESFYVIQEKFSDIQTSENMNLVAEFDNGILLELRNIVSNSQ